MTKTTIKETIRRLKNDGLSYREIAKSLNETGTTTPNGRPWKENTVWYMIKGGAKRQRQYRRARVTGKTTTPTASSHTTRKDIVRAIILSKEFDAQTKVALCQLVLE